jgi:hypothetical protein
VSRYTGPRFDRPPSINRSTNWSINRMPVPRPARTYLALAAGAVNVLWMAVFGSWLDHTSRLTSVASLGGHHVLVMLLAGTSCVALGLLAPLTAGFTLFTRTQAALRAGACVLSLIAALGVVSLLLGFVLAVLLSRLVLGSLGVLLPRR